MNTKSFIHILSFLCLLFSILFAIIKKTPVPPKVAPLSVGDEPLHLGDFFQLNCAIVHGDSPFNITWLFNNEPIQNSHGVTILMQSKRSSSLNIDSVSGMHAGNYSCIGANRVGSVSTTTTLSVIGLFLFQFHLAHK